MVGIYLKTKGSYCLYGLKCSLAGEHIYWPSEESGFTESDGCKFHAVHIGRMWDEHHEEHPSRQVKNSQT